MYIKNSLTFVIRIVILRTKQNQETNQTIASNQW